MAYSDVHKSGRAVAREGVNMGSARDYIALLKPRVMSLVVFTALVGIAVAPGHINPVLGAAALIAIAVGAGAAGALNMWFDSDIDRLMRRTAPRPIPAGRLEPGDALGLGLVLAVASVTFLGLVINWVAAGLLAFTIFFYVVIYTMWLKRSTSQNIVIGGAAGALPPVIGWAAVTGTVSIESLALFLIIFLWTPPHFWALSLYRSDDYARAGVPMLPVVSGAAATKRQILIYAVVLAVVAATLPPLLHFATAAYGVIAGALGVLFIWLAWQVYRMPESDTEMKPARRLFAYSMLYLFLLFAILLVEGGFRGWMA
ncbi:MAG TPA: heme o synthase [Bauldia sp.]|nr:heme o synthase [Bauldia sp.]